MKTKQTLVCGTRNLCFALAAIFALAFIACDDGSGDDKTAKKKFTVTFDSNGGSDVSSQTVAEGGKATKPADPTKDPGLMAGLWTGTPPSTTYTFAGWQKDGAAYDFNTPVTANITLTAAWTETASGTPINLDTRSGANIIAKSVDHINADTGATTEYTLVLNENVTDVASITHNKNGVTLTITSADETERTISKGTENGSMFHVGGNGSTSWSDAKLVIDGTVTLQGNSNDNPAGVYNSTVVYVVNGGSLELKGNAKITGNTSTWFVGGGVYAAGSSGGRVTITMSGNAEISGNGSAQGGGGGVYLYSYANLTMNDNAAIKNNIISGIGDDALGGGVYIGKSSTFTMNGGEISGNTATTGGYNNSAKGGGVFIGEKGEYDLYDENGSFIVASEAVKANIKNNTAAVTNPSSTSGTAEGAQVYKDEDAVFTVGGVDADTY